MNRHALKCFVLGPLIVASALTLPYLWATIVQALLGIAYTGMGILYWRMGGLP